MNRKFLSISVWQMVVVFSIAILGIIFGTFFDLQISKSLVDTKSFLGGFVETLGESFAYSMIPIGGMLVFVGTYKMPKIWQKIIGYLVLVLSMTISTYFLGSSFCEGEYQYGITMKAWLGYTVAFLIMAAFAIIIFFVVDQKQEKLLIKLGAIILISMFLQFLVMHFLKAIASRPRYRYLIDSNINTVNDQFRPWYDFKPFTATNDFFKSWPSGHTATAAQTLLLPILVTVLKAKSKSMELGLYLTGLFYTVFVAFARVEYGAHFLSDVSFGLLFASIMAYALCVLFECVHKKEKANTKENKQA